MKTFPLECCSDVSRRTPFKGMLCHWRSHKIREHWAASDKGCPQSAGLLCHVAGGNRQTRWAGREERRVALGFDSVGQCWQAAPASMLPFPMDPKEVRSLGISRVWSLIQMPQVFKNCYSPRVRIWLLLGEKISPSSFSDSDIYMTIFCSPSHLYFNSVGN